MMVTWRGGKGRARLELGGGSFSICALVDMGIANSDRIRKNGEIYTLNTLAGFQGKFQGTYHVGS
jgi:hypothetical protein